MSNVGVIGPLVIGGRRLPTTGDATRRAPGSQ
jgi:hypothetical protein